MNNNLETSELIFLDNACTATRMLEKRRQLFEIQDALDAQKDEFARKEDAFRRREDALRKKDLQLQESLIKFNKFLQENESKRTRAMKRTADEKRQIEQKEKETISLTQILNTQIENEKQLASNLEHNMKYQNYLSSVVDHVQRASDDFPEVQDILNRHNTLRNANRDLMSQQARNVGWSEERRGEFLQFLKDGANGMLNRNNEIAGLQKELETCTLGTVGVQSLLEVGIQSMSDKTCELGQVIASVENLYERFEEQRARRKKVVVHHQQQGGAVGNGIVDGAQLQGHEKSNAGGGGAIGDNIANGKITVGRIQQVIDKLDHITEYMIDYRSIIDEWDQNVDGKDE